MVHNGREESPEVDNQLAQLTKWYIKAIYTDRVDDSYRLILSEGGIAVSARRVPRLRMSSDPKSMLTATKPTNLRNCIAT
jgi:hypothetical protein